MARVTTEAAAPCGRSYVLRRSAAAVPVKPATTGLINNKTCDGLETAVGQFVHLKPPKAYGRP